MGYCQLQKKSLHGISYTLYQEQCKAIYLKGSLLNPFPNDKFLDSSKTKEFADDYFKFDENGRQLSKRIENTVRDAHYEQFLLFPQCF